MNARLVGPGQMEQSPERREHLVILWSDESRAYQLAP